MMHRPLAAVFLLLVTATTASAEQAVFIVRHAERADASTSGPAMMANDPELSAAGRTRADRLARMLADARIATIYTTEYTRATQTAAPLAKRLGIDSTTVSSKETARLVEMIRKAKGNVLVVGHSNTVPDIIKGLGISEPVSIGESEFDNLFIVSGGTLVRLRF